MTSISNKIIPLYDNKYNIQCCICLDIKKKYIICSNEKCTDGIICLSCIKKMSIQQLNQCPICRVKMDTFIIKKSGSSVIKKRNIHGGLYEKLTVILLSITICVGSYILGLCIFMILKVQTVEVLTRDINPLIFILIGLLFIVTILFCISSIRSYYRNYYPLATN